MKYNYKDATLTKLANQVNGDNKLVATQFMYDNLDDVFETTVNGPISVSKGSVEIPMRIYPIERQRGITEVIAGIMETEEVSYVNKELGEDAYLDMIVTLDNPKVQYLHRKLPKGYVHILKVTKMIGSDEDIELTFIFTFSEKLVLGAHSLFVNHELSGNELAIYLYETFIGAYSNVPKFARLTMGTYETRVYPDNKLDAISIVNNRFIIRATGEATLAIDMSNAVGEVKVTHDGYIILVKDTSNPDIEVQIYV